MTSRIIRKLQHDAVEDPEMAHQYSLTIERIEAADKHPGHSGPMIHRTPAWRTTAAICKRCGQTWHGVPNDVGCPTSCFNLRD